MNSFVCAIQMEGLGGLDGSHCSYGTSNAQGFGAVGKKSTGSWLGATKGGARGLVTGPQISAEVKPEESVYLQRSDISVIKHQPLLAVGIQDR